MVLRMSNYGSFFAVEIREWLTGRVHSATFRADKIQLATMAIGCVHYCSSRPACFQSPVLFQRGFAAGELSS